MKRLTYKKLFSLIVLLLGINTIQAQDFNGRKSIGLNFFAAQTDNKEDTAYSSSSGNRGGNINVAYFLNNDWQVGIGFGLNRSSNEFGSHSSNKQSGWNWQLFARNYYWSSKKTAFFLEPAFTYQNTWIEDKANNLSLSTRTHRGITYELNAKLGFLYTINQRFGVDLSFQFIRLGYGTANVTNAITTNGETEEASEKITTAYFALTRGIGSIQSVSLGFKYFFK
ncbi:hypothetical protein BKI52_09475 [marine bacterium AO1-C]|nr:hypothetical protein BKI52_09475 [marine bacterium AO1-C]